MHLSLVQMAVDDSKEANVEDAVEHVRTAASDGADLVVLPEIWNVGYFAFENYADGAEPIDGSTADRMASLADEFEIFLHAGSIVEAEEDDLYNTSLLFGPDGDLLASYRKIHLFGYDSRENELLTPGEEIVTVDTALGTLGLTTCYDLRFPELYRAMCDRGVDLILVTSAWPEARLDHWRLLNRTRALEEQVFLAAANLTGENAGTELGGNSLVVDPWGVPRVNCGYNKGVTTTAIDLESVASDREEFPALADRRIDLTYNL